MKIIVDELNNGHRSMYKLIEYDNDGIKKREKNIYFIVNSLIVKNYIYYFVYDQDGNLCKELFNYVNYFNFSVSNKSKINIILYIKRLMEFSAIIDKPIPEMDGRDLNNFQYFLSGLQIPISNYEFYTTKNANLETSKSIIKRCQDYMKYCGYKNYNLLIARNINRISNSKNLDCPKFISIKEFNSIIKYIMNDESLSKIEKLKYECIYTLMFDSGLRIGEVLGLTLEDFEPIYSDKGKLFYKVIIRNRLSDNKNQHAKRCCNVLDRKIYMSSNYHKKNIGYQIAYIKEELYEKIIDYFDMNFNYFINQKKNYPIADSVNNDIKNYYIFTNKTKATCLSLFMIYKYTRKMFLDIGIQIDYLKNKNNLLHRFRHGYAMKLLYLYKLDPFEVIHYTRHASVRSLEAYNNPTDEQLTSILERVEEI